MNKLLKQFLLILCFLLLLGVPLEAYGLEAENVELADYLNKMGMLKGTGQGYALESETTRAQSAAMIVRLLGKEEEAIKRNYEHAFSDVPDWADPYVGYLYYNNISNGIEEEIYGSNEIMNGDQYMAFLIRVLGYDDKNGDFIWNKSLSKAKELGILSLEEYERYQNKREFLRDDMVRFSYNTLRADLKNGNGASLLRKLMDEGAILQTAMLSYQYAPYQKTEKVYQPISRKELEEAFITSVIHFEETTTIDVRNSGVPIEDIRTVLEEALSTLQKIPGYFSNVEEWRYTVDSNILEISYTYDLSKEDHQKAQAAAKKVAGQIIHPEMSDYERELKIHDYIVDHTTYSLNAQEPYNMYGVFVKGEAVCQGYAEAFLYLSTLAGLDCEIVTGEGFDGGVSIPHAWNIVEIEGDWYLVDSTWDDPITADGTEVKNYYYFNLTDEEMKLDHISDGSQTKSAKGTKYHYYRYNNLIVKGKEGLKEAIYEGFKNGKERITFMVVPEAPEEREIVNILQNADNYRSASYNINTMKGIVDITKIKYQKE